jgi:hypothetical protein
MDHFHPVFLVVFASIAGFFLLGRIKYGSWVGAFLRGRIEQTYGEIVLSGGIAMSHALKVVQLRDRDGQAFVGLVITTKAPLAVKMTPFRLSKDQARELCALLSLAAQPGP